MQRSNFHTHSVYSDGKNTVRELTEHALLLGFHALGFSDHSYAPTCADYSLRCGGEEEYIRGIRILGDRYAYRIKLYAGLELDCDSDLPDADFDYIISSAHGIHRGGEYYAVDNTRDELERLVRDGFGGSFVDMSKAYFEVVTEHIIKNRTDIVGHFDLITKFGTAPENDDGYIDGALEAAREIVRHCSVFELNTGAIARGLRSVPYPATFIINEIKRMGGRLIVTSDCHYKDRLTAWFDGAEEYLSSLGFTKNVGAVLNSRVCGVEIWE